MGSHCVHGAVDGLRTRNAAEPECGGAMERAISGSGFQRVHSLAVLAFDGREGQSHFLADRSR
jgi:hypothetical protein